ncbi:DUF2920 family protein [Campylobacter lari]|uniref:DUF2920 family protein n=3 Tax=Campylobacter lari TaxID=201 RepID=UPI001275D4E4|nr:DUF2920 family protein [Campylobacter lari]EAI4297589.1 DUF2920 family protein [Campylobacter lari]EAK9945105.1 DUF2920 family protein [Campylobacter lari]ECK1947780.1 DUF2920 family protein [Campylobacter lari]MBT0818122.1 DUF2920 family protein [Campylobacter lari]MBT0832496.1 DUF2920 family protein [Campylobacter lari]
MLQTKFFQIPSFDDIELNIQRQSLLDFRIDYDDEKEIEAIVFLLPGLGGDISDAYQNKLIYRVLENHNVICLSVDYFCIQCRPQNGAKLILDNFDQNIIASICSTYNINTQNKTFKGIHEIALFLNSEIEKLKQLHIIPKDEIINLSITFEPTKNEYQNFGIMQALDCLQALAFTKNIFFNNKVTTQLPVVLVGTSHGGYVSHLMAKLMPWEIDGVIDNSSYAKVFLPLVGFTKELDFINFYETSLLDNNYQHLKFNAFTKTHFTSNPNSPYYFSKAFRRIRNILDEEHLQIQAQFPKTIYRSYHSIQDLRFAPPEDKIQLYKTLKKLGFDADLTIIEKESQVDGKFIKNLEHGMGMSLKMLINKELPIILEKISKQKKKTVVKKITYPSENLLYTFSKSENDFPQFFLDYH